MCKTMGSETKVSSICLMRSTQIGYTFLLLIDCLIRLMKILITLDISSNKITASGVDYLAQMLKINTVIFMMFLCLGDALCCNWAQTLTTLNLKDNEIKSRGAEYLAGALQHNKVSYPYPFHANFLCS